MRIRMITDKPEHPVLAEMLEQLGAEALSPEADAKRELARAADLYLLKSHEPAALALARRLEDAGQWVVNSVAATTVCLDRLSMAERLDTAAIPAPRVLYSGTLEGVERWEPERGERRHRGADRAGLEGRAHGPPGGDEGCADCRSRGALDQRHIAPAEPRQVIEHRGADHATPDNDRAIM